TPITSLVQLPSSFTVYEKEKLKSSEPALWTFAGIVIPMDEPVTVPVPSPLNVRMPSDVNDCPKEPSVGVKLGLNPGPGAAVERQAILPVKPSAPLRLGESAVAVWAQVSATKETESANVMLPVATRRTARLPASRPNRVSLQSLPSVGSAWPPRLRKLLRLLQKMVVMNPAPLFRPGHS